MAKSSRASSKKANNQRLKKNVFGPVETARVERLSARLMELASQPKPPPPEKVTAMDMEGDEAEGPEASKGSAEDSEAMDVDSGPKTASAAKSHRSKKVEKRRAKRKSALVFPKYKDRVGSKQKKGKKS